MRLRDLVSSFGFSALLSLACAGCDRSAAVVLGDHHGSRVDGRVQIDLEVIGSEQGGGSVGPYCVSAHWFPFGTNFDFVGAALTYAGSVDHVVACSDGHELEDGSRRTFRLVSTRTDIAPASPMRLQVSFGDDEIATKDTGSP